MNTMKWLIRREFWEHKGALLWAPVIVGLVLVAFVGATTLWGAASGTVAHAGLYIDGQQVDIANTYAGMSAAQRDAMATTLASSYLATSLPLFIMLAVIIFFYCLGAMADERRDRSILFWKSLPLSDRATVLSKVATALALAPAITLVVAFATSLAVLLIGALVLAFKGINLFGVLMIKPALYLAPLELLALLPVYALWALPTVGWLLMVSAWARSKVFLWAVGIPALVGIILKWTNFLAGAGLDPTWYVKHIVIRGLGSLVPGSWLMMESVPSPLLLDPASHTVNLPGVLAQSYLTLAGPGMWVGVAAGVAMICAAIRLRRWRDEG